MAGIRCCFCVLPSRDNPQPLHPLPATHPLLTRNDPPAESDAPKILNFLADAKKRRDDLDCEIAAANAVLEILVKERDLLAQGIRSHEAAVSPLRQLPTEILCRIFVTALKPLANFELPKAPWYLGQICKRWREIAIGMPVLWSSFWAYTGRGYIQPPRLLEQFQEQFRRAGDTPLDVTVCGGLSMLKGPLLDACDRWQTLSMDWADNLLSFWDRVPLLRRVYVREKGMHPSAVYEFSAPFEDICDLASCGSYSPLTYRTTSWEHLTRYDGPVEWKTYLDILRQATRLIECRMTFCTDMTDTPLSDDILELPNLLRFSVSTTHCLKYLSTSRLQEFVLHGEYSRGPPVGETAHVGDFLRRAQCTLLRLTMQQLIPTLEVLHAAPSLCELTVIAWDPESMTPLIRLLSPVERDPSKVLTNLRAISLGSVAHLPNDIVIEMITARFNGADGYKRLQFFGLLDTSRAKLKITKFRHTLPMQRLAEMQKAGLELCLVKSDKDYRAVLASDLYSIRRCAKYRNPHLTSSELWEYV
ncbi:hypothetical protein C8R47DRAFT_1037622 [Mycena vitilis]|nr:hypothetical protein C8R47DRAFT_1037622 [Mycena vitilis]